ncbi:MAG: 3-dehydroquinate synthase [Heliobacteriaceae bacterium]|nr:3-dehydroquinate synthase [Heliobacteriaceae bacterium]MDD4587175.1 3-dehydroquinate synthase [Heliobacteriaceae bacterium]
MLIQEKVTVGLGDRSYPVLIGEGLLASAGSLLAGCLPGNKVLIVTNPPVRALYGKMLQHSLQEAGYDVSLTLVPDGEQYKNLTTMAGLYDAAVAARLERSSTIVALGGGVAGDQAGFLAATFMRGIGFVQVPTTLLAQVDASVGGKTGVNHPRGKNLIGAFYQPRCVLVDPATLQTLPDREVGAGFAEAVKTALLGDEALFRFLEADPAAVQRRELGAITRLVAACCHTKAKVVAADEQEAGLRAVLNLGHTFGHAVETLTGYQVYRHGEAVAIGLVAACRLAETVTGLPAEVTGRVYRLLRAAGLPVSFPAFPAAAWRQAFSLDKKVSGSRVTFVLPTDIGLYPVLKHIPLDAAIKIIGRLTS